jgi:hypothetical protein
MGGKWTLHTLAISPTLVAMPWLVRRFLVPFALGSLACTILLLVWAIWSSDTEVSLHLHDFALAALFVLPFEAVGLALLVPIALLLGGLSLPTPFYPLLLAVLGSALGTLVVLPISDRPYFLELTLPASCGALSALIWFAFNRDAINRRA